MEITYIREFIVQLAFYKNYLSKGDFDNAMKQYTETIGHVEPSKIIKKVFTF